MTHRRYHVLVLQDDERALGQTVALLKRAGYVVAGAGSRQDAAWWLAGWPIDLAIATAAFDGGSGLAALKRVRTAQPRAAALLVAPDGRQASTRIEGLLTAGSPASDPDAFLAQVAQALGSLTRRQRWPRKTPTEPVPVRVGRSEGLVVDVSAGGLKIELMDRPRGMRSPVRIEFPRSALSLKADVIWSRRTDRRASLLGAAVAADESAAAEWQAFVQRV